MVYGHYCLFHSMFAYFIFSINIYEYENTFWILILNCLNYYIAIGIIIRDINYSIFFFIIAIMMFARKSKVETVLCTVHHKAMNRITILEMNIMIMMIVIMDQIEILMTTMVTIIITSMTIMKRRCGTTT